MEYWSDEEWSNGVLPCQPAGREYWSNGKNGMGEELGKN